MISRKIIFFTNIKFNLSPIVDVVGPQYMLLVFPNWKHMAVDSQQRDEEEQQFAVVANEQALMNRIIEKSQ